MPPAGRLNRRVTIQSPRIVRDRGQERIDGWTDLATVWAAVEPVSAREHADGPGQRADTTHRVTLRYRSDVALTSRCRLKLGARILQLAGPPRDLADRHETWELDVVETE